MSEKTLRSKLRYFNDYYEQQEFWGTESLPPAEAERVERTLSLIPKDVNSILDIGCGDGRLMNKVTSKYEIVGVDISWEALKYVKFPRVCCDAASLPFRDRSFDLILCTEVFEHLPCGVYERAIQEISRVSRNYIIVSVPNEEFRERLFVKCAYCGCIFHVFRHLRSFTLKELGELFKQFSLNRYLLGGSKVDYNKVLLKVRHIFGRWSVASTALCPQCGNSGRSVSKRDVITLACGLLNRLLPSRRKEKWIIAFYQRINS